VFLQCLTPPKQTDDVECSREARLDHEYLRTESAYRQLENVVANYNHSGIRLHNAVNFCPQMEKNRTICFDQPQINFFVR